MEKLRNRKKEILETQKQKTSIELKECTFNPIIRKSDKYLKKLKNKKNTINFFSYEDIVEKTEKFKEKKLKKREENEHLRNAKEMANCTFTPNINKFKPKAERSSSFAKLKKHMQNFEITQSQTIFNQVNNHKY